MKPSYSAAARGLKKLIPSLAPIGVNRTTAQHLVADNEGWA